MSQHLTPFGNALAGALGGCLSNAVVYPLDTVKTKVQADTSSHKSTTSSTGITRPGAPTKIEINSKSVTKPGVRATFLKIWKENGVEGFYRGFPASMLNTFSMHFAYFYFYSLVRSTYKKRILRSSTDSLSTATELLLGAMAGVLSSIFTIPVSVIATRQQLSHSEEAATFAQTASTIISEDGITGLWRGLRPSLVLTVNPAITYGVFERLRTRVQRPDEVKMGSGKAFLVGALSKALATIVTYPYIMAKVRLQARYTHDVEEHGTEEQQKHIPESVESSNGAASFIVVDGEQKNGITDLEKGEVKPKVGKKVEKYNGAIDVLMQTMQQEGLKGWYRGMQAHILKATLAQALLFGFKDVLDGYTLLALVALRTMAVNSAAKKA